MLMVLIDNFRHWPWKVDIFQDFIPHLRVASDDGCLFFAQSGRFGQIVGRQSYFADIVQQGGNVQSLKLLSREAKFLANCAG